MKPWAQFPALQKNKTNFQKKKKKLALKKFPLAVYKKRGLVYRGDFTPKDSG